MRAFLAEKRGLPDTLLWPFPLPETVGMRIDADEGHRIAEVDEGSPAAKAGFQIGDVIDVLDGQPIFSIADLQWVLHNTPREATLSAAVRRDGKPLTLSLALTGAWREQGNLLWRRSIKSLRPGFKVTEVPAEERAGLGLPEDALALRVTKISQSAGIQEIAEGDILTELDGRTAPLDEAHFIAALRQRYPPGSEVPVVVLREGQRHALKLTIR